MSTPLSEYTLPDYIRLVAAQVGRAADNGDRVEVVRLLTLLRETCAAKIAELQPPTPEQPEVEQPEEPEEEA
jgi:hypothetical protein